MAGLVVLRATSDVAELGRVRRLVLVNSYALDRWVPTSEKLDAVDVRETLVRRVLVVAAPQSRTIRCTRQTLGPFPLWHEERNEDPLLIVLTSLFIHCQRPLHVLARTHLPCELDPASGSDGVPMAKLYPWLCQSIHADVIVGEREVHPPPALGHGCFEPKY